MALIPPPVMLSPVIFTPEDKANLEGHLKNLETARGHINMARNAGFDVTDLQKQHDDARERLLRIKNVYFPGS